MHDVFVGRQAIYDRERNVVAWELLFRSAEGPPNHRMDGNQATAQTLLNAVAAIGLDRIAGLGQPVFLNCTREFLNAPPLLPPDRCVLEVLEDIPMDDALLASLDRLRGQGYRIALDDFAYEPKLAPLVERAHIVKVDVLSVGLTALPAQVQALRPFGVSLLAEKIDSEAEMKACHELGFELFQGYYLRRPDTLRARSVQFGRMPALVLLAECQKEDADLDKIARVLASDAALSFKTLQLANSALFRSKNIASLPQAVSVIGLDALARWSSLLMLSGFDNCPRSYLERALERGRMCELLAECAGIADGQSAYLAGLLSILEAVMETPLTELAPQLPVSQEIKAALTDGSGGLGRLLRAVIGYDSGARFDLPIPGSVIERCYWDAREYAESTARDMGLH